MLMLRRLGYTPELAVPDAMRALSSLDLTGASGVPGLLACHPVARGNPYQWLLYGQLAQRSVAAVPAYSLDDAAGIAGAVRGTARSITHLHWLNVVTAGAQDAGDAMRRVDAATAVLDRLADSGSLLIWTVHNALPHDSKFEDADIELRRRVVERAGRVHVMSEATIDAVAPWFSLDPARTFTVGHPSYDGVYPSWMSRAQARYELGIEPDAVTFVLFGSIAPYKGANELVEAFGALAQERPGRVRLLIAGAPASGAETETLREAVMLDTNVVADLRKIPDAEVQLYLKAADVAVLPYRRSLNSGALNLALTFGLPVLLPASSGEAEQASGSAWAHVYDDADSEGLLVGMRAAADQLVGDEPRRAALAAAAERSPAVIGAAFAEAIATWLDEEGVS
jgi:beta-1,4-mannosyltransferase